MGAEPPPSPALPDSGKPGLFRVKGVKAENVHGGGGLEGVTTPAP